MFRKLMILVAVLVLLTVLAVPLVVAQQDTGENPSGGGATQYSPPDSASTAPTGTDLNNENASFSQYALGNPDGGTPVSGQVVPVCPGPAAPGTARCHSLVVVPGSQ